jgi:hypothetical protein
VTPASFATRPVAVYVFATLVAAATGREAVAQLEANPVPRAPLLPGQAAPPGMRILRPGEAGTPVQAPSLPSDAELAEVEVPPELVRLARQLDADAYAARASARAQIVARKPAPDELMALLLRRDLGDEARHVLVTILRERIVTAPRGALGIRMEMLAARERKGVRITGLIAGMPAERVLKVDDVVTKVNGVELGDRTDLIREVQGLPPGAEVAVVVERARRDARGEIVRDAAGGEQLDTLELVLRLGSTDELAEKGDPQGGIVNIPSLERQMAAEEAAKRFLPRPRTVDFPARATPEPAIPVTVDSTRKTLMELQLGGGDADLVRGFRARLEGLAQQSAREGLDAATRARIQSALETLHAEIRSAF